MSQQKKPQTTITNGHLDDHYVRWAPKGSHPSQVSGLFKDDPTFAEFREILRQQREDDYQEMNKEIDAQLRREEEDQECSSSTPTPSRMPKTRTRSSVQK
jgi:hypothetical protein